VEQHGSGGHDKVILEAYGLLYRHVEPVPGVRDADTR
jgi:hypothetical protein